MAKELTPETAILPATTKQTYAIFCLGGGDVRNQNLTRQQASDMIGALMAKKGQTAGKASKDEEHEKLWTKAVAAGRAAGQGATPTPMVVGTETSLFSGQIDYSKPVHVVNDGPCGFAWIKIKPANSAFAKWLLKNGFASKDSYEGGISVSISDYNQSITRKEAHAYAMAQVLSLAGIRAYASSRMD